MTESCPNATLEAVLFGRAHAMIRTLTHTLLALAIASMTVFGMPCSCEVFGPSHDESKPVASGENHGCCPGETGQQDAPAEPQHDCPHCASGHCAGNGDMPKRDGIWLSAPAPTELPPFVVASAAGADIADADLPALYPTTRWSRSARAESSRRDTYARINVIPC